MNAKIRSYLVGVCVWSAVVSNAGAAVFVGTLASWDFDDGDLVVDTVVSGIGAEVGGAAVDGSTTDLPILSISNSPVFGGSPSLQVVSTDSSKGAAFTITNNTAATASVEAASIDFVGVNTDSFTLFFTEEPLPTDFGWLEIDDGIAAVPNNPANYSADFTDFFIGSEGKVLQPGESFSIMLTSNNFGNSTILIDSVSFSGTAVPEPSHAALLLCGLALFSTRRRRS